MMTSSIYQKYLSLLFILILFLSSCANESCPDIPGLNALLQPKRVILLGEIHGTQEAPEFVNQIVCVALNRNMSVTVGLELPNADQQGVELYLNSKGKKADQDQLLKLSFWEYQDGRASLAMFELLEAIRQLRRKGESVDLLLFDNPNANDRDYDMALHILAKTIDKPTDLFVALSGNVHNEINQGSGRMGRYVMDKLGEKNVISLNQGYVGGSAWVCLSSGCGPIELGGNMGPNLGVIMENQGTHNGFFGVDSIHASPPAREEKM